jgi:hypothetical protein
MYLVKIGKSEEGSSPKCTDEPYYNVGLGNVRHSSVCTSMQLTAKLLAHVDRLVDKHHDVVCC